MRKPEINFRKITKYYSFRLFQSMFRLEKDIKSGSPATAVIYYVSTSLISCLGFDSCFRAHHCSVITTHPCSSYYLHLCTESPSMAQTHCCPVSQFLFFFSTLFLPSQLCHLCHHSVLPHFLFLYSGIFTSLDIVDSWVIQYFSTTSPVSLPLSLFPQMSHLTFPLTPHSSFPFSSFLCLTMTLESSPL